MLLLMLATMLSSPRAFAQTDAEYNAALAAIGDQGDYYITTDYAGTKYYLTAEGTLTDSIGGAGFFFFQKVTNDGTFKTYGYLVDSGEKRFSNPASSSNINDTKLNTSTNNRHDWEAQVFFMNAEGKFAVRATNAASTTASSGWNWCGQSFWTVKSGPNAGYSFDVNYIWTLEDEEGNAVEPPSDGVKVKIIFEGIFEKYANYLGDEDAISLGRGLGLGTDPGQYSDDETWELFLELMEEVEEILGKMQADDYDYASDPDALSEEEAQAMDARADSLYQKVLDSEVPYTLDFAQGDGYYRIIAHNRYKSKFDESGFVDKAIAASYSADHKGKAVYGTLRRDLANYLWKLTKSENGDSIMIQNAGMGTYISFSSDNPENKVILTEDASDASCVMFDYAGADYVMPDGIDDDKDIFAIRLAGKTRDDNRYIHQMSHSSVKDQDSPWGNYGTDSGQEIELGFWRSTWNYALDATDRWASEWFLEYVDDAEAEELIEKFEIVKNHDVLVAQNNKLREEVKVALETAKDAIKTKMITSASQMTSPYSCDNFGYTDGGTLASGVLIDGDKSTYWHTDYNGYAPEGYHYVQISGMEEMVGDCELYLCQRSATNDHPSIFQFIGTNAEDPDAEDAEWEVMIEEMAIPNVGSGEENTIPFYIETPYKTIRILALDTEPRHSAFWHAAELQIYTISENPNSQFSALGEIAIALENTYNDNIAVEDADITLELYQALLDAYKAFLAGMVDPTELRTALETYANVTKGVVEGTNPGEWASAEIAEAYDALRAEVAAYDKAGIYNAVQNHKYAVMLKAMNKSVMEQANGVKTDKWYHIMFPTEEMYTGFDFDPASPGGTSKIIDNPDQFGYYVVSGIRTDEIGTDEETGEEKATGNYYLENVAKEDVREGMSMYFVNPEDIVDADVSMFRFVEKEADAPDYASLLADMKENMLMALDMSSTYTKGEALITDASQLSTNAPDPSEGLHIEYAVDGNPNTFWHSDYHKKYLEPAYLQVALNEPVSGLIQVDVTRRQGISYGHMVRMYIQGSNDAETWTNIGYLETPYTNLNESVTSQPVDLGGSYKHLRFILTRRAGKDYEYDPFAVIPSEDKYDQNDPEGWTYFHVAEFQIYPVTPNTELSSSGKTLQSAYTALNKIVLKDATARDVASSAQAYRTYRSDFNVAEGKDVLPYGKDKADAVYAIQNKATGLFVNCKGSNNANNSLELVPTFFDYKAIGFQRSLIHGTDLHAGDCSYLHSQNFDHRFVTWNATTPNSNSGLVIVEAEEEYAAPAEFSFYKSIKPGQICNWCNSVSITPKDAPEDAAAYTCLGAFSNEEGYFVALKTIESIPAGHPTFYIYGDTLDYDAEDDYVEDIEFTMPGTPEMVEKGDTINGAIGVIGNHTLKKHQIYFSGNKPVCVGEEGYYVYSPKWGVVLDLDVELCPVLNPEEEDYDFAICLNGEGDKADGVENISTALENIGKPGNVYSMDGKLLRSGATLNSLKAMGKGMYILNGVKVLVK